MSESMRVMLAILNSNRSLPDILKYIVTHVSSRLLECQGTAIFTVQPKDHSLIIQAAHGLPFDLVDAQFLPGYDTAKKVVRTGLPMTVTSAHTGGADDDANFDAISVEWAMVNQMIVNYQSWMAVPLVIKGETYGAILMYYSDPHEFTSEEINLALMFSDQVALAIENARLRSEAEKAAVIAERNRLARELHDAVSQTLFSANIIAEVLPRLWDRNQPEARKRLLELQQLTHGALAEMRTLLYELRPSVFKEAKLGELLKQLIQGISVRAQIPIDLVVEGDGLLPAEVQIVFYRITQEALNNVIKHANPNHVEVKLQYYPESVSLTISDDGCGFDPERVSPEHFGLSIMQERATTINAKLKLSSQPGKGTQVMVTWTQAPLKEKV
jgi:signal transduction histidine kinase